MRLQALRFEYLVLAFLAVAVAFTAGMSLSWRLTLDPPVVMYVPFQCLQYGLVPYRDIFDQNAPGSFVIAAITWLLVGDGDRASRYVDLAYLLATMLTLGAALRPLGLAAVAAPILYAGVYLNFGPLLSYQREFQMLLPLCVSLWATRVGLAWATPPPVVPSSPNGPAATPASSPAVGWLLLLAGIGIGCAITIKPGALLALPLFAWWWHQGLATDRGRNLATLALGAFLPVLAIAAFLAYLGGLAAYLDIVRGYYPLYSAISGDNEILLGFARLTYGLKETAMYILTQKRWETFAVIGLVCGWQAATDWQTRRLVIVVGALLPVTVLYALFQGKFYDYHWLPFHFACALAAGLTFATSAFRPRVGLWAIAAFALLAVLTFRPSPDIAPQWRGKPVSQLNLSRVDTLEKAILAHSKPNEAIQVLDWSNGGAHAALRTRRRMATSFFQDFMFYHHVGTPYVEDLRTRFLTEFDHAKPPLVVRVNPYERLLYGPGTVALWPELEDRLAEEYDAVERENGYILYRRKAALP